ncbi:hypothetical protein JCM10213_000410 [Rhodosporidiobolus nylandii]
MRGLQPIRPVPPSTPSAAPHASTSAAGGSAGVKRAAAGSGARQVAAEGTAPKKTRQRPALSCQECRRLKLKCDRVWPCSSCRKRNCADICPSGVSKPPGRAVRIAAEFGALLRRVDELEAIVRELGAADRVPPPLQLEEATKRSTAITKDIEREIEAGGGSTAAESQQAGARHPGVAEEDDGMQQDEDEDEQEDKPAEEALKSVLVGVGSLSIAESGRTRFLGPAAGSAYYFEDDEDPSSASSSASRADSLAGGEDGARSLESPDGVTRYPHIQLGDRYPKASEIERLRGFLPDREEAQRLSENYWSYLSFQFTPVSASQYWDDYLPCAYTPHSPHGTKLACVFIVLALGCLFNPAAPPTPNAQAHTYFILSQTVLSAARYLANSTLAAIQTLQLTANYLLNYHDLKEGGESFFPMLGMALRMLVTQGLHRDGSSFGLSGEELNSRRRMFYELITLERMQAFISGRPYMISNAHFDTQFPDDADGYQTAKWKLGLLIGKVIDNAFSVATPSYGTILALDQDLRDLVASTPQGVRSGALPETAFVVKPNGIPQLPPPPPAREGEGLMSRMRAHTLDQMFSQVLFYLHKPGFAQALVNHPEEPLKSPWASSVAAVSLETAPYLLGVAKSWNALHPVGKRWWHVYFHAYAGSVAQASLVIKSPRSVLAGHAWRQVEDAVAIFEIAGSDGAPVAAFVPRLRILRDKAFLSLQNAISIPLGVGGQSPQDVGDALAEGTDASAWILSPPTRLQRRQRKKSTTPGSSSVGASGGDDPLRAASLEASSPVSPTAMDSSNAVLAEMLGETGALSAQAPPVSTRSLMTGPSEAQPYTPFDEPITGLPGRNGSVSSASGVGGVSSPPVAPSSAGVLSPDASALLAYHQQASAYAAAYGHSYHPQPPYPAPPSSEAGPSLPSGYRRPSSTTSPPAVPAGLAAAYHSSYPLDPALSSTQASSQQALAAYIAALQAHAAAGHAVPPFPPPYPAYSAFSSFMPPSQQHPPPPPPAAQVPLYPGARPTAALSTSSSSPSRAFSISSVSSPPAIGATPNSAASPPPPQFTFGTFATAFPTDAPAEGGQNAEGAGIDQLGWMAGQAEAGEPDLAWFNTLGGTSGASPLDWDKYSEP